MGFAKTRQNQKRTTARKHAGRKPASKPKTKVVPATRRANPKRRLTANEIRRLVTKYVTKPWPLDVCRELAFQTLEGQRVAEAISPLRDSRKDLKAQAAAQHAQRTMVIAEELRAGRGAGKDNEPGEAFTAKASSAVAEAEMEAKRLEIKIAEVEQELKDMKAKRRDAERTASKTVIDAWTGPSLFEPPEAKKPAEPEEAPETT